MARPESIIGGVRRHYGSSNLTRRVLGALADAGKDLDHLTPEDVAPISEFHIRGRKATLELARAAGLTRGSRVLDVGSGVGGPSRCLAAEFGCRVTGVDLTHEYCQVATELAGRIGLADLVAYHQADAVALPFPDASFDFVWTQHAAMNIPDKETLYQEMHRVLEPGGALAVYDVLEGPRGGVLFPVPWARTLDVSFLVSPAQLRKLLESAGFEIVTWEDTTEIGRSWFTHMARKIEANGLPALGFHILLGPEFEAMARNQSRNLEEGRIVLAQVVARK